MKKLSIIFLAALISGCAASGAKFSSIENELPGVDSDKARVYVYRLYSAFGAAMRPVILVDDTVVGKSIPGGMFYTDVISGQHTMSIPAELYPGQSGLTFNVVTGEVKYIKTWVGASGIAGRTNMAVVPEAEGRVAVSELVFTGKTE